MIRRFIVLLIALSLTSLAAADPLALTVHADQTTKTVDVGIYGQFLEHIFNSVHGGLWGDPILNGTLELRPPRGGRGRGPAPAAAPTAAIPRNWEFVGDANKVTMDRDNPFNAEVSAHLAARAGSKSATGPGIRQRNIALRQDEKYTLSLYARGSGSVAATFYDGNTPAFSKTFPDLTAQWQKFTIEFTALSTIDAASLLISGPPPGSVNIDRISLFSASALATGGYRPDLLKAVGGLRLSDRLLGR